MNRRKQPPPNAARMYRHFAVVTLALTAVLAVFADGESRQALADEMKARQQKAELARASREKFGAPKLVRRDKPTSGFGFGSDSGAFGEPMDDAGGANPSGSVADNAFAPSGDGYVPGALNRYGLSEAQWNALSEEQKARLADALRARKARIGTLARRQQLEGLTAASRARSGQATAPS